ncbi:papain-like cysteine protease family protein [Holdemania massiliensis]|uniref:papain-like cysteine protease family protein n=1 Tax=Holdemania massiliensis TaxID=1468449 RepID=UPI001F067EF2|nr:papain-like cysteine protease family protein [Holdemania massiliensis]MCH1940151.1 hypothetical protein [Holdemania massiliensis]
MKKLISVLCALLFIAGCSASPAAVPTPSALPQTGVSNSMQGNFTDEMKLAYRDDLDPEAGADSVEREGDHSDSPYFSRVDFYNAKNTDTLTILPQFQTMQQTSEWSCGVVSALLVLNYYDQLGDQTERTLAEYRSNGLTPAATDMESMIAIFDQIGGFELESSLDYSADELWDVFPLERFEALLKEGTPVMVAWNDWGGHWQVVIGYDNMGTETTQDDVLIVADPYDTTDHNQDGYTVYGAERFYYNWTMYDFFEGQGIENQRDLMFLIAKPIAE